MLANTELTDPEVVASPDINDFSGLTARQSGMSSQSAQNVLMICGLFGLPYRALRCAVATGAAVHVLGNHGARGFKYSRFCASFTQLDRALDGTFDDALASAINTHIDRLGIDVVMAGDQPSSRALVGVRPLLRAPCFPMPDLATFDLLNDKWEFFKLCSRLGIHCPPTRLLPDRHALAREIEAGSLSLPLIAKPLSLDGNRGVVPLLRRDLGTKLATIRYEPVLVQDFIAGVDIGASAFCDRGEIRGFILHRLARATYSTFSNDIIFDSIRRIAEETAYSGVFNFDMRLSRDGKVYMLECNPRFFYKMDLSMLAGINFLALGLQRDTPTKMVSGTKVRLQKAVLAALPTPWRLARRDLAILRHRYSDPLSYLRQLLHIDWEDRSY
jgi:predicted ATP-grasp superfamily ATP-dependent carboligase